MTKALSIEKVSKQVFAPMHSIKETNIRTCFENDAQIVLIEVSV